ncbi:unnamed protein product [Tilletia controversa]|uniref:FAD-binding PCMH-type domain-containing protein n=3 Tax=Tilletia TaxID=13289 RepID=A0A8X7MUB0_9BASI|nr:hypothetical protein CF336_g8087 [Tilletia laevis]KAE8184446.1 hypothetical protein CF328_g7855 [Tilletia controversa]KAE8243955.1 hypothetical protein A4X03_0g7647 [Tilletia caries]KAE8185893.1 hypothetical protein CF335_g7598 [Tilletia laevis]KAE8248523.1 hypothetical protein A4X06_0g3646 [Tilletia controversa]
MRTSLNWFGVTLALFSATQIPDAAGAPSSVTPRAMTSTVRSCFSSSNLNIVYPSDSSYSDLAKSTAARFNYQPSAIALPSNPTDVQAIVRCVGKSNGQVQAIARGGGHSYEAYSSGGRDGVVVIDLRNMKGITVNQNGTVFVSAGAKLGALAETLADQGYALPHGTCASVGVAGHALGGGFAFQGRAWGYLMDRIVSMRYVKPDGSIVYVTAQSEPDLWFALRGAGAAIGGVVTRFEFKLEKAPTQMVTFTYTLKNNQACASALLAWDDAANTRGFFPPELGGEILVYGSGSSDGNGACSITGAQIDATKAQHTSTFSRLLDAISEHQQNAGASGATSDYLLSSQVDFHSSWRDGLLAIMGSFDTTSRQAVVANRETYYAEGKVQFLGARFTPSSARDLVNSISNYAASSPQTDGSIAFDLQGVDSVTNTANRNATSILAGNVASILQFYAYDQASSKTIDSARVLMGKVPDPSGISPRGYSNYPSARFTNWPSFYYGAAAPRLKALKNELDSQRIFTYQQSMDNANI